METARGRRRAARTPAVREPGVGQQEEGDLRDVAGVRDLTGVLVGAHRSGAPRCERRRGTSAPAPPGSSGSRGGCHSLKVGDDLAAGNDEAEQLRRRRARVHGRRHHRRSAAVHADSGARRRLQTCLRRAACRGDRVWAWSTGCGGDTEPCAPPPAKEASDQSASGTRWIEVGLAPDPRRAPPIGWLGTGCGGAPCCRPMAHGGGAPGP